MTHPLTPREQYEQAKRDFNNMRDDGTLTPREKDLAIETDPKLSSTGVDDSAIASGSGDHAELARLADRNVELSVLAYKWLEAHDGSHERGCEGRNMSCTCGDDERGQALLTEAAALHQRVRGGRPEPAICGGMDRLPTGSPSLQHQEQKHDPHRPDLRP